MEQPARRCAGRQRQPGLSAPGNGRQELAPSAPLDSEHAHFGHSLASATPTLWVTHAIVAANVIVFLAMLGDGAGWIESNSTVHLRWGANFGPLTKEDQWWRLLACTFLHFGVVHVAMNLWALWGAGRLAERLYGNATFAAIYLFAGLTGSFGSLLWNADNVVSVGASGAVFGVYGALAAYVLRQPGSVPASVLKSLKASTIAFIAYAVVLGAVVSAIDNAAHVGGLLGGFGLAWLLARPLSPRPPMSLGKAGVAVIAVVIAVASLYAAVPPPAYSYSAQQAAALAIQQFTADEDTLAAKAAALVEERKAGSITDRQLGEAIESQLLPGWDKAHARFAAIDLESKAPAFEKLGALKELVAVRREMFSEYAAGLKTGNAARIRRAEALSATSQRLSKALREQSAKP